jgi:transcriptional regulator with XRE-family HTH domain
MPRTTAVTEHERLRRLTGRSVTGMAEATGFSHALISMIEAGTVKPSARYRAAACRVLGVPERVLFPDQAD